jgi:hypothetical protein
MDVAFAQSTFSQTQNRQLCSATDGSTSFAFLGGKQRVAGANRCQGGSLKQLSAKKAMCVIELKAEKAYAGQVGAGAKVKRARTSTRSRVWRTIWQA